MKTNALNQRVKKVLLIAAFMCVTLAASASSWTWSECVSWFKCEGKHFLTTYAHPTYNVDDIIIIETYPDIVVKVYFEGHLVDYSCKYRIKRGYKNGTYYFSNVEVLSEGNFWVDSFKAWDLVPKFYGYIYKEEGFRSFFGEYSFSDMYPSRKAAAALTMELISRQF